jgi:hypothetical protein
MDEPKLSLFLGTIPKHPHRVKMKKALLGSRPKPPTLDSAPAAEGMKPTDPEPTTEKPGISVAHMWEAESQPQPQPEPELTSKRVSKSSEPTPEPEPEPYPEPEPEPELATNMLPKEPTPEPEPEPEPELALEPEYALGSLRAVAGSFAHAFLPDGTETTSKAELCSIIEQCCFLRDSGSCLDYIRNASEHSTIVLCQIIATRLSKDTAQVQRAMSTLRATIDDDGALQGKPSPLPTAPAHQQTGRPVCWCPLLSPMQVIRQQGEGAVIGRGAHGGRRVFRAKLTVEQAGSPQTTTVAVKLFPGAGASDLVRNQVVGQLRQAIDSVAHCAGIVTCYGVVDNLDHCVGVVTPVYAGSVKDYLVSLGSVGLPPPTAVHFALQIVETLVAVHAVVGATGKAMKLGNVRPSNCLLGPGDRIYLCEVGITSVMDDANAIWRSQGKSSREAAWYQAPESFSPEDYGDISCEEKVDIWSWGCVLLEMAVGQHPWALTAKGKKSKPSDIMKLLMKGEVPQPPPGADRHVIMCFHLAAAAFEHRVADRPTAAQLLPRVVDLWRDLL